MENKEPTQETKNNKFNYSKIIPIILGIVILVIAVIGIVKLIQWNRGEEFIIDENINVDTEPEDFVFFMDPSRLEGNNYDGEFDILILGNDTVAYDKDGTNIAELVEEQTGANVYNCAFDNSFMCAISSTRDEILTVFPADAFCFFWLSDSIQSNNWQLQEDAIQLLSDDYDKEHYREVLNELQSIDFNKIDLLLIYYDGHDYLAGNPISSHISIYEITTMEGGFTGSYERYPINYPYMQHMLIAPTFCYVINEDGSKEGCDIADLGWGNLPTCQTTLQVQAQNYGVSYLDNFYGININAETADQYLMSDGITPNEEGREMIANRISECINARIK